MARRSNRFLGAWRITATGLWAAADLDQFGPAHITFGASRRGALSLVAIEADIDYRVGERGGKPAVEFTWQGSDDGRCFSQQALADLQQRPAGEAVTRRHRPWTRGGECRSLRR
jgi:hypothetical protein